jgi:hypothetical protein
MDENTRDEQEELIGRALEALESFVRPNVRHIVTAARDGFERDGYAINIPDPSSVDMTIEEMAAVVAQTSNHYGKMTRLAGLVNAALKISEGKYKKAYKVAKVGSNEAEREANAIQASNLEHNDLTIVEAAVEIANALERSARIASESSRKIFDKILAQRTAENRGSTYS